jgi:hypothetical protein
VLILTYKQRLLLLFLCLEKQGADLMAEQFLNRLNKLEEKIDGLGETLKRMITILSETTEVRSEVRVAKDEILDAIKKSMAKQPPPPEPQQKVTELISTEFAKIEEMITEFQNQIDASFQELLEPRFQQFQEEVRALLLSTPAPPPAAPAAPTKPATEAITPSETTPAIPAEPISATKSMKIAEHLQTILKALKMGCKSGDVLDTIAEAKDNISKIVESDPISVKIDKWASDVGKTPRRKELQARDILKIKKQLRKEIDRYSPA